MTRPENADGGARTDCRYCKGSGVTGPVHINRGDQPHEWRESMPCRECGGTGRWSAERYARWEIGQALRRDRISRDQSLREAARAAGISPADLSAMEAGRLARSLTEGGREP